MIGRQRLHNCFILIVLDVNTDNNDRFILKKNVEKIYKPKNNVKMQHDDVQIMLKLRIFPTFKVLYKPWILSKLPICCGQVIGYFRLIHFFQTLSQLNQPKG